MCLSDLAASNGSEENEEIDRSLLKSFLLLGTVVPAVCNMGARVLPTGQILSEIAKQKRKGGGDGPRYP